jgi:hypothetical protein
MKSIVMDSFIVYISRQICKTEYGLAFGCLVHVFGVAFVGGQEENFEFLQIKINTRLKISVYNK